MKLPTDLLILDAIYERYDGTFRDFTRDEPTRNWHDLRPGRRYESPRRRGQRSFLELAEVAGERLGEGRADAFAAPAQLGAGLAAEAQEGAGDGAGLEDRARDLVLRRRRRGRAVLVADLLEATGGDEGVDGVPAAMGGLSAAVRAVEAWPAPGYPLDGRPALEADGLHAPRVTALSPVS